MFAVIITDKGGKQEELEFDQAEISIGRAQGNDIVLAKSNISKRHAKIVQSNGSFVVVDAKSTNGTYVNGKRIEGPHDLQGDDKVFVGDYTVQLLAGRGASPSKPSSGNEEILPDEDWDASADLEEDWDEEWEAEAKPAAREPRKPKRAPVPQEPGSVGTDMEAELDALERELGSTSPSPRRPSQDEKPRPVPRATSHSQPTDVSDGLTEASRLVHTRLLHSMDLRRIDVERMDDEELRDRTRESVEEIVQAMSSSGELQDGVDTAGLIELVLDEALGLGPLEEFLQDDSINEIMVNSAHQIFVERLGKLEHTDRSFSSDEAVLGVIERIVAPLGRRIDESSPMVDARLKDGSRVNAIVPPLALRGPSLTIRKFKRDPLQVDDLVAGATVTPEMAEFLETCVLARKNIIISGGTGSGKTTTLNVLSSYIPETERIITIEDAAELQLDQVHLVSLESRPPNIEGRGAITIRDLVRNALRMRPDRIVVGECRGGEALDMLQAMNTGHDGSLTTVHANSPRDALARLETMILMSGMDLPVRAIREHIASAINVVVQQTRFSDGSRKVTHISEITGMETEVISMQDIFVFEQEGFSSDRRVLGRHRATGFIPRFYEDLKYMGIDTNLNIFRD